VSAPLNIDDAVTVVSQTYAAFTLVKRVTRLVPVENAVELEPTALGVHTEIFTAEINGIDTHGSAVVYQLAHEGVNWIRGAHPPTSREAQALLAAHALVYG
jgi:hypothetical protein